MMDPDENEGPPTCPYCYSDYVDCIDEYQDEDEYQVIYYATFWCNDCGAKFEMYMGRNR